MKKTGNLITLLIVIVLLAMIGFSGYKIVSILMDYHEVEVINEEAREEYVYYDKDDFPIVDFDKLTAANNDIVGWLYIPDTNVNFPIVKGEDNDVYLHNDYLGRYNFAGSIFMDYRCNSKFKDRETMIYGHNMHSGAMFGRLKKYDDADYLKAHKDVYVLLPNKKYIKYSVASAGYISVDDDVYTLPKDDGKPETMVLSTCTDSSSDTERFVLICDYEGKHKIKKNNN
ncbi:MAG: class B sortase [Firmicutes bacterium]|nr:class B sortase [Bacillota bacterium]